MPYRTCKLVAEKLWMPPVASAMMTKNVKHIQIAGSRRKANNSPLVATAAAVVDAPDRASSVRNASRFSTSNNNTASGMNAAATSALRQLDKPAIPVRNSGAAAQPRLPDPPCTENAWPIRAADTPIVQQLE